VPGAAPSLIGSSVLDHPSEIAQLQQREPQASAIIEPSLEDRKSDASALILDNVPEQAISQLSIQETETVATTTTGSIATPTVDTNNQNATEALFEGYVQSRLVHLVGNTDTMLRLQQETLDRLTIIQTKAEAILTQNFELLEYTIPRLFVVLPDTTSSRWDPSNILGTKFRLHFICECGEHTRTAASRIPHHLHLAKHDGYEIQEANAFFTKYARFLTTMLEILKFGLNITGFVVPALSTLNLSQTGDASTSSRDGNGKNLVEGVDRSISFLEKFKADNPTSLARVGGSDAVSTPGGNASMLEGLEGVDLRQLATYLKVGDSSNMLGNLYRMTTKEGHVKWVCRDHYRAGYQEANYQKLHGIVNAAGGTFDEQLGRITVTIKSGTAAAQLYDAIGTTRGIHELVFTMAWDQDNNDLVKLKNMIKKSSLVALTLDLQQKAGSGSDFSLTGSKRYDPIVAIMQLSSITAIHILNGPKDFFQRANFSKSQHYPSLRSIHIGDYFKAWDTMTYFLRRAPNIERVTLKAYGNNLSSNCYWLLSSRVEQHQRPLTVQFGDSPDRLWFQFKLPAGAGKKAFFTDIFHNFMSLHGADIQLLSLDKHMTNNEAIVLAEATRTRSSLFKICTDGFEFNEQGSQAIGKILMQSPLTSVALSVYQEYDFKPMSSLPWETLRNLYVDNRFSANLLGYVECLIASIEGYYKGGKKPILDRLLYRGVGVSMDSFVRVGQFLAQFPMLSRIELYCGVTLKVWIAWVPLLLKRPKLKMLSIGFDWTPESVQHILNTMPARPYLKCLVLRKAPLTAKQVEMMKARGIHLCATGSICIDEMPQAPARRIQ